VIERDAEGPHAGAAGSEQGPVDIPKKKVFHKE
jgi:hypothetical protein